MSPRHLLFGGAMLCSLSVAVLVGEVPTRFGAVAVLGPKAFFAPIVEVRSVFCGSGCLAFEARDDAELRLETSDGSLVPSSRDAHLTRFDLGAHTGNVSLSWRSRAFDPAVVLEFSGCDEPPRGLRVRKHSNGRATLHATLGLDGTEPFLTPRLPAE